MRTRTRERAGEWAVRSVKAVAYTAGRLRPPPKGIVFLLYHRVGRRSSVRVDLPLWLFEEQMARISSSPGVVDIGSGLDYLTGSGPVGAPPVVVTFDDGTADFVEVALPVLVRYRVPAVLYVATDFIETGRSFPDAGRPASWSALGDALSTGFVTIGSHTHSHLLLDRCEPGLAASDIGRSVDLIGDRLGIRAEHFAYPKAIVGSREVQAIVRNTFRSAAIAGTKPNPFESSDPYRLLRSPVQVEDGLRFFSTKVRGGMGLEDQLRQILNRRRMAGATY